MLAELRIRGLGAIADASLGLGPGFTAITGETGAGKTMLLTGLGLLLGGRADSGAVAVGSERLEVDGRFHLPADSPVGDRLAEAGAVIDDGDLVVARTVSRDGRSRAYAGGRSVPAALLAEVADGLVTVHGQADQRGLLRPAMQREALDRYGGPELNVLIQRYGATYDGLREVDRLLAERLAAARERAREADLLRFGIAEIAAVNPQPGEDDQLAVLTARLGHIDALRLAAAGAVQQLRDEEADAGSATQRLAGARRFLEGVAGHDAELDAMAARVAELGYLADEVAGELTSYLDALDADPQRLEAAMTRLAALRALTRKYGENATAVVEWREQAERRLADIDADPSAAEDLRGRQAELATELAALAEELSERRANAASRLADAVAAELAGLAMPGSQLQISCRRRPDPNGLQVAGQRVAFGSHGIDEVAFELAAHPGAVPRPLGRGASGGELSRVMLALEVVLAGADPTSSFVFDEVDAGIGGRAAIEVGRRLAALSASAQVLVVTHLPHVAAFADRHLVVTKTSDGGGTATDVTEVGGEQRLAELSRMLGGLAESDVGREHAAELLSLAKAGAID